MGIIWALCSWFVGKTALMKQILWPSQNIWTLTETAFANILPVNFWSILTTHFFIFLLLFFRIPKDRYCNGHWICHHGIHRIFRQTHPHSHQQHHCRIVDFLLLFLFLSHFFSSSKNDTITYFCTTPPYVYKFYECAASSILLSRNKEIKPKIEGWYLNWILNLFQCNIGPRIQDILTIRPIEKCCFQLFSFWSIW